VAQKTNISKITLLLPFLKTLIRPPLHPSKCYGASLYASCWQWSWPLKAITTPWIKTLHHHATQLNSHLSRLTRKTGQFHGESQASYSLTIPSAALLLTKSEPVSMRSMLNCFLSWLCEPLMVSLLTLDLNFLWSKYHPNVWLSTIANLMYSPRSDKIQGYPWHSWCSFPRRCCHRWCCGRRQFHNASIAGDDCERSLYGDPELECSVWRMCLWAVLWVLKSLWLAEILHDTPWGLYRVYGAPGVGSGWSAPNAMRGKV